MKRLRCIAALAAALIPFIPGSADAFTLTIVTNPPGAGIITGAGAYATNVTKANVQVQADRGYYIEDMAIKEEFNTSAANFQAQMEAIFLNSLSGGIPDFTVITNDSDSIWLSSDTVLTVTFGTCSPTFLQEPMSQVALTGTKVSLSAFAYGRQLVTCTWWKDGAEIPGATSSNLVFLSAVPTDSGTYTLVTSNVFGVTNSIPATLLVKDVLVFANGQPVTNSSMTGSAFVTTFTIQSLYTNGNVFYTLDGSQPDFSSTRYAGAFAISQSSTLRVAAYSPDFSQSVLSEPLAVTIVPSYPLLVGSAGGGGVQVEPANPWYGSNTVVTVTAVPWPGWTFMGWSGDLTGGAFTNTMVMDGPKQIQALFGTVLSTTVAGKGTVSVSPAFPVYPYGTPVELTAVPAQSNYFGVWGNAGSGNENPLTLSITNPSPTVSALFAPLPTNQTTLTLISDGGGYVSALAPWTNRYAIGATNLITATPWSGQTFLGWAGEAGGTNNPLPIVLDASKVITAHFTHNANLSIFSFEPLRVSVSGVAGDTYRLETSTNLEDWVQLFTATNYFGTVDFFDRNTTKPVFRVYRSLAR